MPETHELKKLPWHVVLKLSREIIADESTKHWQRVGFLDHVIRAAVEAGAREAFQSRDAIVTAARESDAAARIAAQREAASRAWDAAIASRGLTVFDVHATRNLYLDREHPLPARECVLSDGSVVTYTSAPDRALRPFTLTRGGCTLYGNHPFAWAENATDARNLADFVESFAAGVGR